MPTLTLTYSSVPSTTNGSRSDLVDALGHRLGADQRRVHVARAVALEVGQQQQELVASLAGHEVRLARGDSRRRSATSVRSTSPF